MKKINLYGYSDYTPENSRVVLGTATITAEDEVKIVSLNGKQPPTGYIWWSNGLYGYGATIGPTMKEGQYLKAVVKHAYLGPTGYKL